MPTAAMASYITHYNQLDSYITRDESSIRELMHPDHHAVTNQSLAEAIVPAGLETRLHFHRVSEEIYHVTAGEGLMTLGDEQFAVSKGDTIRIAPGTRHCVRNTGDTDLIILCSCAPAYAHEDTVLAE